MQFASFTFLFLFMPITLGIYHVVPKSWKQYVLLGISVLFLLGGGIIAALVELVLTGGTFGTGIWLEHMRKKAYKKRSILLLTAVVIIYVSVLLLLRSDWMQMWKTLWLSGNDFFQLGLSFFTLQGIGYCLDVRRGECDAERNWWKLLLYLLFYPKLMMGPIVPYRIAKNSLSDTTFSLSQMGIGFQRFLTGLAKKLIFADGCEMLFSTIYQSDMTTYSILIFWVGAFAKLLSLYFEFSGYADMAIGLGLCYGVKLPESYGKKLFYPTMTKFTEQWNKTVVQWFFQHIGSKLHGNKRILHILAVVLIWGMIGLWYDFRLLPLLFGMFVGLCVGLEYLLEKKKKTSYHAIRYFLTILLCCIGTVLLSLSDWEICKQYFLGCFGMIHLTPTDMDWEILSGFWIILAIVIYAATGNFGTLVRKIQRSDHRFWKACIEPLQILAVLLLLFIDGVMLIRAGGSAEIHVLL